MSGRVLGQSMTRSEAMGACVGQVSSSRQVLGELVLSWIQVHGGCAVVINAISGG